MTVRPSQAYQLGDLVPDLVLTPGQLHHHLLRLIQLLGAVSKPIAWVLRDKQQCVCVSHTAAWCCLQSLLRRSCTTCSIDVIVCFPCSVALTSSEQVIAILAGTLTSAGQGSSAVVCLPGLGGHSILLIIIITIIINI